ncbi:hypothetical protein VE03_09720 [Pseudogymnoascus sp. 23342-1-I1]|nr:hypothetical protein VE03_09720 [Pseudogymnoascus sp. 23342-1-I1]
MVFREQLSAKRMDEEQKLKSSQGGKVDRKEKKKLKEKYDSEVKKIEVCYLVYVPNEGEDEYTLPGFALEDDDDDDSDAESLMLGLDDKPHVKEPRNGVNGYNLADEYGEYEVKSKIDRYLLESRQKAPKPPTERVFKLSKEELEVQLKALSKDAKPHRKKAIKKKAPLKSAHLRSKTAYPETDGKDVANEAEFIVDDTAIEFTAEDIAKTKALLDIMMKQVKK